MSLKRSIAATELKVQTLCQLNDAFENQEIMNQCIAGVKSHCSSASNFKTCKSLYDETFKESVFKNMEICAPWNSGWKSAKCTQTADRVKLRFILPSNDYKQDFVDFIKNDLFSSRDYVLCLWWSKDVPLLRKEPIENRNVLQSSLKKVKQIQNFPFYPFSPDSLA